jgi:chorismate mutase
MAAELSLEALRDEIDRIDEVIVRLLDRRARCAYAIGRLKRQKGRAIYEPGARRR